MAKSKAIDKNSIFISCVGSNDPWGGRYAVQSDEKDNLGPLLRAWETVRSSRVILFSTPQPTEYKVKDRHTISDRTDMVVDLLHDECVDVILHQKTINPTRYDLLYKFIRPNLVKSLGRFEGNLSYYIGISSGTPQQQSLWISLVTSGQINAEMLQAIDPEKALPGEKFVRIADPFFITMNQMISLTLRLVENGTYAGALNSLKGIQDSNLDPDRAVEISTAAAGLNILSLASCSDYQKAYSALKRSSVDLSRYTQSQWLDDVQNHLAVMSGVKKVKPEERLRYRLLDLYSSAERLIQSGDLNMATVLCFSVYETWLNMRYQKILGKSADIFKAELRKKGDAISGLTDEDLLGRYDPDLQNLLKTVFPVKRGDSMVNRTILDSFEVRGRSNNVRKLRNMAIHQGKAIALQSAVYALAAARAVVKLEFKEKIIDGHFTRTATLKWLIGLIRGGV